MKLPGGLNSPNKYLITIVLVCVIITTFIVTRNKQSFQYGHPPSQQNIGYGVKPEYQEKTCGVWWSETRSTPITCDREPPKNISVKLSPEIQSRIQTLALFIGYPRSGHTLIGALLDAHPHILISNELDIFQRWTEWTDEEKTRENLINKMYENSYKQTQGVGYRSATKRKGRTYAVPNQWQGKYKDYIKVIGDKKGGKATKFFSYMGKVTKEVLDEINLPMKLIHLVRNPYDNIATMILRSLRIRTRDAIASKKKINNTKAMNSNLQLYLRGVNKNYELIKRYGSRVLTLHSEDVIANPKEPLKKLCEFLEVTCTEDYLNDCASIIYTSTSKTRRTILWSDLHKQKVEQAINDIPFLRRYTFES